MILVTGASGHIGNVLVRELMKQNKQVRIITQSGEKPSCLKDFPLEVYKGDVRDAAAVNEAVKGVEIVYHLASIISISSFESPELWEVNVQGTQNIIDACLQHGVKRLVYTSSIHALPDRPKNEIITEESDFNPENLMGAYSRTKAAATRRVLDATQKGLDTVVCFPTAVVGIEDYRGSEAGKMMQDYLSNRLKFYISGEYNFVDVRDVVQGILAACEKGRKGEGYLLSGYTLTLNDLFDILLQHSSTMKKPAFRIPIPLAIGAAWIVERFCKIFKIKPFFTVYAIKVLQSNANVSYEKAQKELDYNPRSISDSIKDLVVWLKETHKI